LRKFPASLFPSIRLSENPPLFPLEFAAKIIKFSKSKIIPRNSGGNADFRQLFQVIIPSGAHCSQAEKRPSDESAL
jgi:hypothetical protein